MTTHADPAAPQRTPVALFCRAAVVDGSASEAERTVEFVASTSDIDGHGTIVRQNWRLGRFDPSGPVLYAHDHDGLPVGTATVRVVDGKLLATVKFSTEDLNPNAELVWKNVQAKVLRGISAGFQPHTYTVEKQNDREVLVLDDNELFELSITPCPSNANALAQMRSLATPNYGEGLDATPPTTSPPAPAGSAKTEPEPSNEEKTMADKPTETNIIPIARALELPAGATESDTVAAAVRLRGLEVQVQALTTATSTAEAIGALRAIKEKADKYDATAKELAQVKAERDAQNFEVLIATGQNELKLTPAEVKFQRELFAKDSADGRGEARVAELKGYLAIKSPDARFSRDVKQPGGGSGGTPLVWRAKPNEDPKPYKDLTYSQRARLHKEDPELGRAMKDDHEASQTAA